MRTCAVAQRRARKRLLSRIAAFGQRAGQGLGGEFIDEAAWVIKGLGVMVCPQLEGL